MKYNKIHYLLVLICLFITPFVWGKPFLNKALSELIRDELARQPMLCLGIKAFSSTSSSVWENANDDALYKAGLLIKIIRNDSNVYEIAPEWRSSYAKNNDFCYGNVELDTLVEKRSIGNHLTLIYRYKISEIPQWAFNKDIQFAFSELDLLVNGIATRLYKMEFEKNSNGIYQLDIPPEPAELFY